VGVIAQWQDILKAVQPIQEQEQLPTVISSWPTSYDGSDSFLCTACFRDGEERVVMIHAFPLVVFEHGRLLFCLPPERAGIGKEKLMRSDEEGRRRQIGKRAEEWTHPPILGIGVASPSLSIAQQFFFAEHGILLLKE
jgi:hypothetical protein